MTDERNCFRAPAASMRMTLRRCLAVSAVLVLLGTGAFADEITKKEKTAKLVDALGFKDMFSERIDAAREQGRKLGKQIVDQMEAQSSFSPNERARIEKAFEAYMDKVTTPLVSPEKLAATFGELFASHFTEAELDKLIEYYASELGKKEVEVSKKVIVAFNDSFEKDAAVSIRKAMDELVKELSQIGQDCQVQENCGGSSAAQ